MEVGQAGVDGVLAVHLVERVSKTVIESVPLLLQHMEGDLAQAHGANRCHAPHDPALSMEAGQVGADGTLATGLVALALSNVLEAAQIRHHYTVGRVVLEQRERNDPVTSILALLMEVGRIGAHGQRAASHVNLGHKYKGELAPSPRLNMAANNVRGQGD